MATAERWPVPRPPTKIILTMNELEAEIVQHLLGRASAQGHIHHAIVSMYNALDGVQVKGADTMDITLVG